MRRGSAPKNATEGCVSLVCLCDSEARAILAETEPDLPLTAHFGIERIQGAGRADDGGRVHAHCEHVALAESLAAFVNMEAL
jgi:hypothetical protein